MIDLQAIGALDKGNWFPFLICSITSGGCLSLTTRGPGRQSFDLFEDLIEFFTIRQFVAFVV